MAFTATSSVSEITALVSKVNGAAVNTETALNQVRTSVSRANEFTGTAADNYDQFLAEWSHHQALMIESMRNAAQLLASYAERLSEIDDGAFSLS